MTQKSNFSRQASLQKGLRIVAGVCDGGATKDGMGFNKEDAQIGKSLSEKLIDTWSEEDTRNAERMCRYYHKQIPKGTVQTSVSSEKIIYLPHDENLEYSILSRLILDPESHEKLFSKLEQKHFYASKTALVFKSANDLYNQGVVFGIKEICTHITTAEIQKAFGSVAEYSKILDEPMAMDVDYSLKKLKEFWAAREIVINFTRGIEDAQNGKKPDEIVSAIFDAINTGITPEFSEFPVLNPDKTILCGKLVCKPDEREYHLSIGEEGFLPKKIVGEIVAPGGTGKTMMILQLGMDGLRRRS